MYVAEQPVQMLLSVAIRHTDIADRQCSCCSVTVAIRHTDIADGAVVALTATGNDCILFATLYSLHLRQNIFCESICISAVIE
jgi:hypothetical protein